MFQLKAVEMSQRVAVRICMYFSDDDVDMGRKRYSGCVKKTK